MTRQLPTKLPHHSLSAGTPAKLGAHFNGEGVNFAVFSSNAERIELCLFTDDGKRELARIPLKERTGDIWHIFVAGLGLGTKYGYRVFGPYAPEQGHRFNPHKLLLDPYARQLHGTLKWSDTLMGYKVGSARNDLSFDTRDNAFAMPKSVVVNDHFAWADDRSPQFDPREAIHYEAHIKGMTASHPKVDAKYRGKYLGMASEPVLEHLTKLGINTVQLMPVHAFINDRFLIEKGLTNYWGYNTIGFFAPEPRYLSSDDIWEFRAMVQRFHHAGIQVILDVVYNHTAEGNEMGPTLAFRGLDNAAYYRLAEDKRYYYNDAGCGNNLNLRHPMVLRMVMDSLRYWVEVMGVDGFRFDLATVLVRGDHGYDANAGFLSAIRQDPILSRVKLVVEPWDTGPGGYQLGAWPHPFLELNDRYRDDVRKFWRNDPGQTAHIAKRILGSADEFDHAGRNALTSVNFVTSHDGFTLADTVSYEQKHNRKNGENNQDGHNHNYSCNYGIEGPTDNAAIIEARQQHMRNLVVTLLLSQGTPMLLAGDEMGNSQQGNNNAYAQDNDIGWLNWDQFDSELFDFTQQAISLRNEFSVLRQRHFLHGQIRAGQTLPDFAWQLPNGEHPTDADWHDPNWKTLCAHIRVAAQSPDYEINGDAAFVIFNRGETCTVTLPTLEQGEWVKRLDTANTKVDLEPQDQTEIRIEQNSVVVLVHYDEESA